jgi:hypothetical protein
MGKLGKYYALPTEITVGGEGLASRSGRFTCGKENKYK